MGGKLRPALMAVSAFALLMIASPVALLAGPLAAHQVAAATGDAKHASNGSNHDARKAPAATTPAGAPSADSAAAAPPDHASAQTAVPQPAASAAPAASGSGHRSTPVQIELSKPRAGQPSERADHAPATSRGLHRGAGDDAAGGTDTTQTTTASTPAASSGTPSTGTQAASTPAVVTTSTAHSGATPTEPPVIVAPPAAPQTNPPIAAQPALTGARLDLILVGVVIALAAAVVAAVRLAPFRGRRPPR